MELLTCTRWRHAIQADYSRLYTKWFIFTKLLASQVPIYSGRKLTRLGRAADWSFLISDAVTLQDSKVSERRFFKGFKYCNPSLVMREFETFSDTNAVKPAFWEEKECEKTHEWKRNMLNLISVSWSHMRSTNCPRESGKSTNKWTVKK